MIPYAKIIKMIRDDAQKMKDSEHHLLYMIDDEIKIDSVERPKERLDYLYKLSKNIHYLLDYHKTDRNDWNLENLQKIIFANYKYGYPSSDNERYRKIVKNTNYPYLNESKYVTMVREVYGRYLM